MCGIVGYVGSENKVELILKGLETLEYRGYDSAGIATVKDQTLLWEKSVGKLENLIKKVDLEKMNAPIGIGHTRWATHGAPSELNSHPHISYDQQIAVVHNGIIENYLEIKKQLQEAGIECQTQTDTEVIAHLLSIEYKKDHCLLEAMKRTVEQMQGAYALAAIAYDNDQEIVAVRKDSPLVIGIGRGENFLASDVAALISSTREVKYIENDEYVRLTPSAVCIYDTNLNPVERSIQYVDWDIEQAEKGGFEHFTMKEIFEQPAALKETITSRLKNNALSLGFHLTKNQIKQFNRIYIVACGTAYHAGLYGKYIFEKLLNVPVIVEVASEFRYAQSFLDEKTLFIAISQSGETIDTLKAVRKAKEHHATVISILNVVGSSIARDSDEVFYTWAGPEIGVASTKAYTTQLASLYMIALNLSYTVENMDQQQLLEKTEQLAQIPILVEKTLELNEQVKEMAEKYANDYQIFFMGRLFDYYTALEASLKLKEISYINSFAIQSGELKHGTIALVDKKTLCLAVSSIERLQQKTFSNLQEVEARGAQTILISPKSLVCDDNSFVLSYPAVDEDLMPLLSIIPLQLFAYHISNIRGNDVDKPRNLAKSVTVE